MDFPSAKPKAAIIRGCKSVGNPGKGSVVMSMPFKFLSPFLTLIPVLL